MRTRPWLVLWLCSLLWLGVPVHAAEGPTTALRSLLRSPALRGARVGVVVEHLGSGERLLARHADRALVPASNQKVVVAAAALSRWGPAHRFETPVYTAGPLDDGVLDGTLWIEGRGDPGLVSEALWRLAEEIALRGVREIRGGIGIDVGYFDGARTHPDWEPVSARAYHAPSSAFAANYSSFRVEVEGAAQPGQPVIARVAPAIPYFGLRAEAITLDGRGALAVERAPLANGQGELVHVSGVFPVDREPRTYWRSVSLPEHYAGAVLRAQLEAQGIRVRGPVRIGTVPADAEELLRFRGERLDTLVHRLNKYSNNFIAEQLTRLLGAEAYGPPASWSKGARFLHEYLRSLGVDVRQLVIADGSGLSPRNRLSPAVLVRVIRESSRSFVYGPEFLASLPLGGLDGTLEDRMNGDTATVRGKTGHLRHVSSLCGVLPGSAGGGMLSFAVIVNGARGNALEVDEAIDGFVAALHGADVRGAPATPAPSSPE